MNEYNSEQASPTRRFDYTEAPAAPVMRLLDWLIVLLITIVPVVNVIVLIIWALDDSANPNRTNFARAALIFVAAQILFMSIYIGYFTGMIVKMANMF
ncbi:MAG: hypothetical protein RBS43_01355 [Candidatus Cloacimonas sp.]|jgi:uncharacterized membrane protein YqjE|nr:hypothetical protein [Candidatus Cloacimonas sp.]